MPLSQDSALDKVVIAALYVEAVRKGQALWFHVASGSMRPLLRIGDEVCIEPAIAEQMRVGEIAAFETAEGLIIHRIAQLRQENANLRLVEMSDVYFRTALVEGNAVVGRVVAIRRGSLLIDLRRPIAQMCGRVTARARYWLYGIPVRNNLLRAFLRKCARLVARCGSWITCGFCSSTYQDENPGHTNA